MNMIKSGPHARQRLRQFSSLKEDLRFSGDTALPAWTGRPFCVVVRVSPADGKEQKVWMMK